VADGGLNAMGNDKQETYEEYIERTLLKIDEKRRLSALYWLKKLDFKLIRALRGSSDLAFKLMILDAERANYKIKERLETMGKNREYFFKFLKELEETIEEFKEDTLALFTDIENEVKETLKIIKDVTVPENLIQKGKK
jgi:hypothetical protein